MRLVFFLVLVFQVAHSLEEYAYRFYEVFPLAAILNDSTGGLSRPFFILFNFVLIAFGVFTYWRLARREARFSRVLIGIWACIELYNGVAHFAWALLAGGYIPGLATAPFLFVGGAYMAYRLFILSPIWQPGADA